MKEPYGKGGASHPGPESWRQRREARAQALTGAHTGTEIEPRNNPLRDADGVIVHGRQQLQRRYTPAGEASCAVEGPEHV
jgi:hypothetical protein